MVLREIFRDIQLKINAAWRIYLENEKSGVTLWCIRGQQLHMRSTRGHLKKPIFFIFNGSNNERRGSFWLWWHSFWLFLVGLFQVNLHFKTWSNPTFPQPFRCPIPCLALWLGAPSTPPAAIYRPSAAGVSVSEGRHNYFGTHEWPKILRRWADGNADVKQSNRRWSADADCVNIGRKAGGHTHTHTPWQL